MNTPRLFSVPALLSMVLGGAVGIAAPASSAVKLLGLIPAKAETVAYYPDFKRMETKWAKVVAPFDGKDSFLDLKRKLGFDPARIEPGALVRASLTSQKSSDLGIWLVPAKDPKVLLEGLKATHKNGVWTWSFVGDAKPAAKKPAKAAGPETRFASAASGYLIIADSEASLAEFKKPANTLATELAPYASWLEGHDISGIVTKAAVVDGAKAARESFNKSASAKAKEEGKPEPAAKLVSQFEAKLQRWIAMAGTSVHHGLAAIDLSENGGLSFVAQALLTKDSELSRELGTLSPVSGHPLKGLAATEFALAFGADWTSLFDFQSAMLESLDTSGKVQPATLARAQKATEKLSGMTRSMAGVVSAPAPRGSLMSGISTLVRVSDSKAYLAAMAESSQAQNAFLQELGMGEGAVTLTPDILPGVPSCSVTTRLAPKNDDPSAASSRMVMAMLFGGDSVQMSMAALDEHRVVAVLGGSDLLKTRLEEFRKAPEGLASSITAVEPDLGKDHRFALYLDLRGVRNVFDALSKMFGGGEAKPLPAVPEVPAVGLTLALDSNMIELRGSARAETIRAAEALGKAIGAMMPKRPAAPSNEPEEETAVAPAATHEPIDEDETRAEPKK